jgi:hypothetical protein
MFENTTAYSGFAVDEPEERLKAEVEGGRQPGPGRSS